MDVGNDGYKGEVEGCRDQWMVGRTVGGREEDIEEEVEGGREAWREE